MSGKTALLNWGFANEALRARLRPDLGPGWLLGRARKAEFGRDGVM